MFVLKLTLTLAFVPRTGIPDCRQAGNLHNILIGPKMCVFDFELVRLWSFRRKGQSKMFVLKLTLTLAFVPRTGIPDCRQAGNLYLFSFGLSIRIQCHDRKK